MNERQWVDLAYKKLKGAFYLDKTELPFLDRLVQFESQGIEKQLAELANLLKQPEGEKWEDFIADIENKIGVLVYPKKLMDCEKKNIIFNSNDVPIKMAKAQYFIDMPVMGQLLGVLWILTIGVQIDNRTDPEKAWMYEHSYGNRLRKKLIDKKNSNISHSPYLFEPYFSQYQNWRDKALSYAEERLDTHQDALILMLDLRSFFYSVHISEEQFRGIYTDFHTEKTPRWVKPVHDFIYSVLKLYSAKVRALNTDSMLQLGERIFLPIGFLPSNLLANWFLTPFDKAISDRINPVYYGRYVDDIIIVDKVEKNSELRKKACKGGDDDGKLTEQEVIQTYFCNRGGDDRIFDMIKLDNGDDQSRDSTKRKYDYMIVNSIFDYDVNENILPDVRVQDNKVKAFYFREGSTRALLDCFRAEIEKNASEFRLLPDVSKLLRYNDYSEIFRLENGETPNKLRGIEDLYVDRYFLSKFLGKYRKAGNLIRDQKENAFDQNLTSFMDGRVLIEHYILWERLFEIMVVNERYDLIEKLFGKIHTAIKAYTVPDKLVCCSDKTDIGHKALLLTLRAAVCRTLALCWGPHIDTLIESISKIAEEAGDNLFECNSMTEQRKAYCSSRMLDKYAMPIPLMAPFDQSWLNSERTINLCHLESMMANKGFQFIDKEDTYSYLPYIVRPQEIAYALLCQSMADGKPIDDPKTQKEKIDRLYFQFNYPKMANHRSTKTLKEVSIVEYGANPRDLCQVISVESDSKSQIKIAIGNARLEYEDFRKALTDQPNRSLDRYEQFNYLMNAALKEKADMLVLPENYMPWEWIPDVARLCANNQMALVTGVEHILSSEEDNKHRKVYNLTAIILPYRKDGYPFVHIVCHHKTHYSPEEKRQITGYKLSPIEGKGYQLFNWKDLWFSVYCCYELASIKDRSLFQSLADLTIAVEWNPDVVYFSNIIESMCRDLHCYCVQVNSSDYGDSRVMSPCKTEKRDLIKTKGGKNNTVLVDTIDISALRNFQRMEYELQHGQKTFKPTPPNFDTAIVKLKQNKGLWVYLEQKSMDHSDENT